MIRSIQQEWFSNLRGDLLAGTVVALALIPEALSIPKPCVLKAF